MMLLDDTATSPNAAIDKTCEIRPILIIDDDHDLSESLAFGLSKQGFNPLIASTAASGLMAAQLHLPKAIIMDIRLPDGDGREICERLNDCPETCEIPVIFVSALDGTNIVRETRSVGGDYFVRKPYDPNVLLALLDDVLNKSMY